MIAVKSAHHRGVKAFRAFEHQTHKLRPQQWCVAGRRIDEFDFSLGRGCQAHGEPFEGAPVTDSIAGQQYRTTRDWSRGIDPSAGPTTISSSTTSLSRRAMRSNIVSPPNGKFHFGFPIRRLSPPQSITPAVFNLETPLSRCSSPAFYRNEAILLRSPPALSQFAESNMPLRLSLRSTSTIPIELNGILPELLVGRSLREIEQTPILGRQSPIGGWPSCLQYFGIAR